MAAAGWVVLGVVVGLMAGGLGVWAVVDRRLARQQEMERMEERLKELAGTPRGLLEDRELLDRVLDRLLDATVPKAREESPDVVPTTASDGEYEPPEDIVGDWTDPFIGLERPTVGRLAPGQQIAPGLAREDLDDGGVDAVEMWRESGAGAFDEWARDTMTPEQVSSQEAGQPWVEPLDI